LHSIESGDLVRFGAVEIQFHRAIYEVSGLSYLVEVFDSITTQLITSRFNFLPALPAMCLAHEELIEGFRDRDPDKVQKATNSHTQALIDAINEEIKSEAERKEMVRRIKEGSPDPGKMGGKT
jgi:DNA-binding GntR family transcriptional regulator